MYAMPQQVLILGNDRQFLKARAGAVPRGLTDSPEVHLNRRGDRESSVDA